eukprot:6911963-Prymnesium_polylepis.1
MDGPLSRQLGARADRRRGPPLSSPRSVPTAWASPWRCLHPFSCAYQASKRRRHRLTARGKTVSNSTPLHSRDARIVTRTQLGEPKVQNPDRRRARASLQSSRACPRIGGPAQDHAFC